MVVKASALGYQVPEGLANQHRAEPNRQHPSLNKVTVDSGSWLLSEPEAPAQAFAGGPDIAHEAWFGLGGLLAYKWGLRTICCPVINRIQGH